MGAPTHHDDISALRGVLVAPTTRLLTLLLVLEDGPWTLFPVLVHRLPLEDWLRFTWKSTQLLVLLLEYWLRATGAGCRRLDGVLWLALEDRVELRRRVVALLGAA